MARALTAYLRRSDVPARKPLQQAIDPLKFALTLDDTYVPFETSGYLPCTLDGEDAGFDLRFKPLEPGSSALPGLGECDVALSFKWGGDPREEIAALVVCAALAGNFGALVQAGDAGAFLSADQLLAKARQAA